MRAVAMMFLMAGGMLLGGCSAAVAVVDTGVGVATTAVDVTTDVAGAAVHTVTGPHDDDKKDKD